MPVEILRPDLTPFDPDTPVPFLEAGQDSGILELALRNPGPGDERDLLLVIQVENPSRPEEFSSVGFAPQDELWCRARLVGDLRTDWVPLGAFGALHIPEILEGGVRLAEVKFRPPSTASTTPTWRWALSVVAQEHARAVPPALTAAQSGILTRLGDRTASVLLQGCDVEPSDPPDDQITVTPGQYLAAGVFRSRVRSVHTLDQTDGEGEALASGESYYAVVSLGQAGAEITKGPKAIASPEKPAPPAGTARSRIVLVRYQGTGTSEIEASDVEDDLVYDRYAAFPGEGLQILVHAGQSIAGGTWRFHSAAVTPIAVEPSATNRLWELTTGLFEVAADPPEPGALLLWEAETNADAVVELRDRRTFAGEPVVLRLRGALDPSEIDSLLVDHDALAIERMTFRLSDNGGGSAGETILDVLVNGETAFPSQADDDQRPHFAFDATDLVTSAGLHEVTELRRGDLLTLVSAELPTGGDAAWAEAYLYCRRI